MPARAHLVKLGIARQTDEICIADPQFLPLGFPQRNPKKSFSLSLMTNILGPITMIVLLLSGYVAFKNKNKYQAEIEETNSQKTMLEQQRQRLQKAKDDLAATTAKRIETEEKNVQLTAEKAASEKKKEELNGMIASKTREIEMNKQQLDQIREKTAKIGDIRELASKMRATRAEINELAQNIEQNETRLDQLTNDNRNTEGRIGDMRVMFDTFAKSKSLPTLSARIRSIYPTWGFVTLSSGNDAGVVINSTLDVVRDGATIAKLVVTGVERNTASANIIPDSLAQDITLMVGDRVVPSQATNEPAKPAAGPKAAAEPPPLGGDAPAEPPPLQDAPPLGEKPAANNDIFSN